jgi:hypothetical protein
MRKKDVDGRVKPGHDESSPWCDQPAFLLRLQAAINRSFTIPHYGESR